MLSVLLKNYKSHQDGSITFGEILISDLSIGYFIREIGSKSLHYLLEAISIHIGSPIKLHFKVVNLFTGVNRTISS